jgi:hypothetical protein
MRRVVEITIGVLNARGAGQDVLRRMQRLFLRLPQGSPQHGLETWMHGRSHRSIRNLFSTGA